MGEVLSMAHRLLIEAIKTELLACPMCSEAGEAQSLSYAERCGEPMAYCAECRWVSLDRVLEGCPDEQSQ